MVRVEPWPETVTVLVLAEAWSVTVDVPRETTEFAPTVPGYAMRIVEPPVVVVTVTVVGEGAEIVIVLVCTTDRLLARPWAFAMAPVANGTPRREQPSVRGVRRTLTSREGSQFPFIQVIKSGRNRPLLSRQMHFRSVIGQLASVDWSMHCDIHFGTFSWANARGRQKSADARIREKLELNIVEDRRRSIRRELTKG